MKWLIAFALMIATCPVFALTPPHSPYPAPGDEVTLLHMFKDSLGVRQLDRLGDSSDEKTQDHFVTSWGNALTTYISADQSYWKLNDATDTIIFTTWISASGVLMNGLTRYRVGYPGKETLSIRNSDNKLMSHTNSLPVGASKTFLQAVAQWGANMAHDPWTAQHTLQSYGGTNTPGCNSAQIDGAGAIAISLVTFVSYVSASNVASLLTAWLGGAAVIHTTHTSMAAIDKACNMHSNPFPNN